MNIFIKCFQKCFQFLLKFGVLLVCFGAQHALCQSSFVIEYADGNNEGFNDPTPATPIGGNTGTTLGQQRRIAFEFAIEQMSLHISSPILIDVKAQFNPSGGDAFSATLASAGPPYFVTDIDVLPDPNLFYPPALANKLAQADVSSFGEFAEDPDIIIFFNTDIDTPVVLSGTQFYYGLDQASGNNIDFASVALHEINHGLGFLSTINSTTGEKFQCSGCGDGLNDSYSQFIARATGTLSNPTLSPISTMNNQLRAAAIRSNELIWTGDAAKAASSNLLSGGIFGYPKIESSDPPVPGSALSHLSSDILPRELETPTYQGAINLTPITLALMADIGWGKYTDAQIFLDDIQTNLGVTNGYTTILTITNDGSNLINEGYLALDLIGVSAVEIENLTGCTQVNANAILSVKCKMNGLAPGSMLRHGIDILSTNSAEFIRINAQITGNHVDSDSTNNKDSVETQILRSQENTPASNTNTFEPENQQLVTRAIQGDIKPATSSGSFSFLLCLLLTGVLILNKHLHSHCQN